ncbi:MAG: TIGR02221 family CRISPR-associated protein [Bacteroidia bacterium]
MRPTLLSFLGIGNYQSVTYQINGQAASPTVFIAHALAEIFEPEKVLIIRTQAAYEKFFEGKGLKENEYKITDALSDLYPPLTIVPVPIPDGKNPDELWMMFQAITGAVPQGCELILDVTHGFRSQPMLALAAAVYLQVVKDVKIKHIFYGAFDAKDENGIAPVFDLMPFMELIQMAQGFEYYLNRGDARPMADMMKRLTIEGVDMRIVGQIRNLGKNLELLSTSYALIRTTEILETAQIFVQRDFPSIDSAMASPFLYLIELAKARNEKVAAANGAVFSKEGILAQSEIISRYLLAGQYQQAVTLAREAMVTSVCLAHAFDPLMNRDQAEKILNEISPDNNSKDAYPIEKSGKFYERETAKLWSNLREIRNDLNHAAMRPGPAKTAGILRNVCSACEAVISYLHQSTTP